MNRPKRYLSRESLPYEEVAFDVWEDYYSEQNWMVQRLEKLYMDLKVIAGMRPFSAVNYIRKGVAYEDYLLEYANERRISFDDMTDVLDELQENARGFETFDDWFAHIEHLQEEMENQVIDLSSERDAVMFSTLHSAKGLEYQTVFLVDVNEGIMPYKKAVLEPDLEEERRLAYVGITRAKEKLYITHAQQRMLFGSTQRNFQSKFIKEIDKDCIERIDGTVKTTKKADDGITAPVHAYTLQSQLASKKIEEAKKNAAVSYGVGDRVKHNTFGEGTIVSMKPMGNDHLLEIAFDTVGTKKIMANFAKIVKIS